MSEAKLVYKIYRGEQKLTLTADESLAICVETLQSEFQYKKQHDILESKNGANCFSNPHSVDCAEDKYMPYNCEYKLLKDSDIIYDHPKMRNQSPVNPSGTKGFGTHTKHQGGVKKDPRSISRTRNATNLKPSEGLGVSFKVSKNLKLV